MESSMPGHLEVTETLVRLYVFLAQHLNRCLDEAAGQSLPEQELQAHLSATRATMMDLLAVNPVVKRKVEGECDRILSLGARYLRGEAKGAAVREEVQRELSLLRQKTIALSDLLAVFRAM